MRDQRDTLGALGRKRLAQFAELLPPVDLALALTPEARFVSIIGGHGVYSLADLGFSRSAKVAKVDAGVDDRYRRTVGLSPVKRTLAPPDSSAVLSANRTSRALVPGSTACWDGL